MSSDSPSRCHARWAPPIATPAGFALLVRLLRRVAPDARGSGIRQVIAARLDPDAATTALTMRTALAKFGLPPRALRFSALVGREGPIVWIAAGIMVRARRLLRLPVQASVIVAGGAAGITAAFDTPLAGVAFAIEALAAARERRMTLPKMTAVPISAMVSLGIAGDYVYFGEMRQTLALSPAPVAGCSGGLAGGSVARAMLAANLSPPRPFVPTRARPALPAAYRGVAGAGDVPERAAITEAADPWWFGPAKDAASLAIAVSRLPGGIVASSLAAGSGLGGVLGPFFAGAAAGPVVPLGMAGCLTVVVHAPPTTVITPEATAGHDPPPPLVAAALVADGVSSLVCPGRLYAGLAGPFVREIVEAEGVAANPAAAARA